MTRRDLLATKGGLSAIAAAWCVLAAGCFTAAVRMLRSDSKEARRG